MSIGELPTRTAAHPGTEADVDVNREADNAALKKADKLIVAGALASGSFILGPVGIILMLFGFVKLRQLAAAGKVTRPWLVTIMGVFCLVDAGINMIGWSVDLLLHDTGVGQTVFAGYGRLVDGGYYLGYNHLSFGGTPFVGEKILEVTSVVALFPIRIAAAWAFFRQKRWGLQYMILTSWMYMYLWIAYLFDKAMTFPLRFGTTEAGIIGFWAFNVFYWTPFLMLPALYSLKRYPCWADD